MRYLLWSEGTSDAGLCHVLNWLLARLHVDVSEAVPVTKRDYPTLEVLFQTEWADLLFLHCDADSEEEGDGKGPKTRRSQLENSVRSTTGNLPPCVLIVPVQETEAWLLAQTDIPLASIETQTKPKEKLKAILEEKLPRPLQLKEFATKRSLLWAQLVLDQGALHRLEQLPAFQQLIDDTTAVINKSGFTQY